MMRGESYICLPIGMRVGVYDIVGSYAGLGK